MRVFAIIVTYFFTSCNSFFGEFNSPKKHCNVKSLQKDIQINWKYNDETKCYVTNDSFINRLNTIYYGCIYNTDTSFIIKHFGRNFMNDEDAYLDESGHHFMAPILRYSLYPPCPKSGGTCSYLYFWLNKNYKIIQIKKGNEGVYISD